MTKVRFTTLGRMIQLYLIKCYKVIQYTVPEGLLTENRPCCLILEGSPSVHLLETDSTD